MRIAALPLLWKTWVMRSVDTSAVYVFMSCKWIYCLLELSSKELRYTWYTPSTTNRSHWEKAASPNAWEKAANEFLFLLPHQTEQNLQQNLRFFDKV